MVDWLSWMVGIRLLCLLYILWGSHQLFRARRLVAPFFYTLLPIILIGVSYHLYVLYRRVVLGLIAPSPTITFLSSTWQLVALTTLAGALYTLRRPRTRARHD